ncbi:hypothetical protein LTR53_004832 [Teratosphaeriaceae sp. CCFEE 6253]|nr:hypothetical protein LTR53_004832 [Teratosphaeriaceae sp. CCFEE 6253]
MASLLTALGLRASNPLTPAASITATYLITNYVFAYLVLASRTPKQHYGLDHNVSPREDLGKYGDAAVRSGKMTQKQLDQLRRLEGANANSIENYILFVAAMLFAQISGMASTQINATGLCYTVARFIYAGVYVFVDTPKLSQARGIMYWTGNFALFRLIWISGNALNSKNVSA